MQKQCFLATTTELKSNEKTRQNTYKLLFSSAVRLLLLPGTRSRLLSGKPDEWMHLSPLYTRMHGEWLRYAKSTSQYSLAFSLKVRDDWGFQVNPLCHHDITSPFPPSGNEGYVRNRDVSVTSSSFFCAVGYAEELR